MLQCEKRQGRIFSDYILLFCLSWGGREMQSGPVGTHGHFSPLSCTGEQLHSKHEKPPGSKPTIRPRKQTYPKHCLFPLLMDSCRIEQG